MVIPAAALFAAQSGLSMMQGMATHHQAYENAEAQNAHVAHVNVLNRKNAHLAYDAYDNNLMGLYERHSQEQQALAQALVSAQKQALLARSAVKAKSAGAGIRGATVNAVTREIQGQASRNSYAYSMNLANMQRQLGRSSLGLYNDTLTKVNNPMLATPASYPSPWMSALSMGGDLLKNYGLYTGAYPNTRVAGATSNTSVGGGK